MQAKPRRETVDLADYPELIVVILGFKLRRLRALPAMMRIGKGLAEIRKDPPDGLLAEDGMLFGWNHVGFRKYWRDRSALGRFTRSDPHAGWWRDVRELSAGAGFWHETYHARGDVEALYAGMPGPVGLQRFAPERHPVGPFMTARARIQGGGEPIA